jgi:tetratricopeptide (TPR) repeat protein
MKRTILVLLAIAGGLAACAPTQKQIEAQREKDPQYQYERAVVCMQYGLRDEAFPYLNRAIALDPRHYLSFNLLGLAYMMNGNLPEAIKAFRACVGVAPANFSEVHNNLGTALQESNQVEAAEAAFKKAYEIDQNYNASYNLAKLYFGQAKLEPALDYVRKSLQKYGRSLLAWNLQGLILDSQEKYDDAMACFQQALKIIAGEPNVSFNLATSLYKNGQVARAKELLEKTRAALEKTPPGTGPKNDEVKARILDLLKKIAEKK